MRYDPAIAATRSVVEWLENLPEDSSLPASAQALLPLLGGDDHNQAVSSLIDALFPHEALNVVEELAIRSIVLLLDMADWDEIRAELAADKTRRDEQARNDSYEAMIREEGR